MMTAMWSTKVDHAGRCPRYFYCSTTLGSELRGRRRAIKRLFKCPQGGHTGSLDPLASGLLAHLFWRSHEVRRAAPDADKTYCVTVRLGERTPSADLESEVIERRELPSYSSQQLAQALADFPREYAQVPPMHSALKQDGKPLYEYARAGITRERAARAIVIHDMHLLNWQPPDLSFDVHCSKGNLHPGAGGGFGGAARDDRPLVGRCADWEWRRLVQNHNGPSGRWNP